MNVASCVRVHARRMPDRPALIEDRETIGWAELDRRIDATVARLRTHDVRAGDVVVISLAEGILQVVLAFAVMRMGAAVCALDWRSKPAERKALVETLSPRLFLADRPVSGLGAATQQVDAHWMRPAGAQGGDAPGSIDAAAPAGDGEQAAILLLSSGTTGLPKATVISHRAAAWRGVIRMANLGFGPATRVLSAMPLSTSAGVSGLLGQILAGATIVFHPTIYAPDEIVAALQRERASHVALVPTVLRWMLELPAGAGPLLPDLTCLLALGAAFHAEEKHAVMARISPYLYENYGSAGTGTICTATPADLQAVPQSVGRPPLFTSIEIVGERGETLAAGEIGRVRVRTPGAASGYFAGSGAQERNEVFDAGSVYPGDLGRIDSEGRLFLEGRAANLILRGGMNVYPEEIERILLLHPAVADAAVIGRPDASLGEVPVALIVARGTPGAAELLVHCRNHLSAGKIPVAFQTVAALPRTAAGKIRRSELAALLR